MSEHRKTISRTIRCIVMWAVILALQGTGVGLWLALLLSGDHALSLQMTVLYVVLVIASVLVLWTHVRTLRELSRHE